MSEQLDRLARRTAPKRPVDALADVFPVPASIFQDSIYSALRQCGYDKPEVDPTTRTVTASRETSASGPLVIRQKVTLTLVWESAEEKENHTAASWYAEDHSPGSAGQPHRTSMERVRDLLLLVMVPTVPDGVIRNPVLPPGVPPLEKAYEGELRDYSGCATPDEVADLGQGVLPLGCYAFGWPGGVPAERGERRRSQEPQPDDVYYGPQLYLARDRTNSWMEHKGILVCAPQNTGKTSLIARWAEAANQAGYNIFLVDVKGNLRTKFARPLRGQVFTFSTDRSEASDRINFLDGLDATTPEGTERIQALVTALLPSEGWVDRGGEEGFHYRNRVVWLTALTHILKLAERFRPDLFHNEDGTPRAADLNDLYDLTVDEELLYDFIVLLREHESRLVAQGQPLPYCGADHWVREAAHLLDPARCPLRYLIAEGTLRGLRAAAVPEEILTRLSDLTDRIFATERLFRDALSSALPAEQIEAHEEAIFEEAALPSEGEREPNYGYRAYTQAMVTALEPFSEHGTLYPKISGSGPGRLFTLEDLGRKSAEPVTIILTAREQDLEKATTVLALTVKRLQHLLFDRVKEKEEDIPRILLLLDETRRIRSFDAARYVTFAREARAGCVISYQSLDQIGDEKKIMEVLENVGTQIYLGSLVGNTARYFLSALPRRYRPTVSRQETLTTGPKGTSLVWGRELVDYLAAYDLYDLPGGKWPALVYLNDLPRRKPFLVDLYDESLARQPRGPGRANPASGRPVRR
jgi:hypothetical protein